MSDPNPDQPYIIWALGAATTALYGLAYHFFGVIRTIRTDAASGDNDVRAELLRTQAQFDTKIEIMRQEARIWHQEAREDRNRLEAQVQEHQKNDNEQHERLFAAMGDLPLKIASALRDRR